MESHLCNSAQIVNKVQALKLQENDWIFTADTNSVYNYIEDNHACKVIGEWIDELAQQVESDYPAEAIKAKMNISIQNNLLK